MMDKSLVERITTVVTGHAVADQTMLMITDEKQGLTRFTDNSIHQNVVTRSVEIMISVVRNNRIASVLTNRTEPEQLRRAVDDAVRMVAHQQTSFPELPPLGPQEYRRMAAVDPVIPAVTPEERGEMVQCLVAPAKAEGATAAGAVAHSSYSFAVTDSSGVMAFHEGSDFQVSVTYMKNGGSAWAQDKAWRAADLDIQAVSNRAMTKLRLPLLKDRLVPGRYRVILEPHAVANLMETTMWNAFGALQYEEGRSFLSGKLNTLVTGESVTIRDNAFFPRYPQIPFDLEGYPRQEVTLIERGRFINTLHDRLTAARHGTVSTGHSIGSRATLGQSASRLVLAPGDGDPMAVDRALLISRFHYNREVDPKHSRATGVTRNGIILVEDGKMKGVLHDLRYNESVMAAFQRIEAVGTETLPAGEYGLAAAPALRIADFTFTETL
ncbi:TldD/PmbA family protein [bacterium]|nr:TldD/PmbA family protein [candidate division CSSED10-310 bacterium]